MAPRNPEAEAVRDSAFSELFAEVLIPRPVYCSYSYIVPADWRHLVFVGSRVQVDFGHQTLIGLVRALHHLPPETAEGVELRPISGIFEPFSFADSMSISLVDWMSAYYFEAPGEVASLFCPRYSPPQEIRFCFRDKDPERLLSDIPAARKTLRDKLFKAFVALSSQKNFTRSVFSECSSMTDNMFLQCLKEGYLQKVVCFEPGLAELPDYQANVFARLKKKARHQWG